MSCISGYQTGKQVSGHNEVGEARVGESTTGGGPIVRRMLGYGDRGYGVKLEHIRRTHGTQPDIVDLE